MRIGRLPHGRKSRVGYVFRGSLGKAIRFVCVSAMKSQMQWAKKELFSLAEKGANRDNGIVCTAKPASLAAGGRPQTLTICVFTASVVAKSAMQPVAAVAVPSL